MVLEIKQSTRLSQQLVVTPQLQQAIKLLQLSRLELNQMIQKEILENPVLEEEDPSQAPDDEEKSEVEKRDEAPEKDHDEGMQEVDAVEAKGEDFKEPHDFDWENYINTYNSLPAGDDRLSPLKEPVTFESTVTQSESLQDHLLWQLQMNNLNAEEHNIGERIIGNINDDGYLTISLDEMAANNNMNLSALKKVLKKIQDFDPIGVGARDLKECLLLQIEALPEKKPLMYEIINKHLGDLETHNHPKIAKELGVKLQDIEEASRLISMLEPKPGRPYGGESPQYIIPDVFVYKVGDEYVVSLNDDGLPKLQINRLYRSAMLKGSNVEGKAKEYIQERFKAAMWLIRSIYQRQRTIYKVGTSIVKFQKDFFDNGISHLKPLVLKEVAEDIEMHESTVSRVTSNKYMHTPRGIFELKFFFNTGIQRIEGEGVASEAVKAKIQKLVEGEDSKKPLSDRKLTDLLREANIDIARRTVAKYREILNIPPSSKRKRYK
ncbi:MAG: RNA polymerase factor sigma-54 [Pseudomonadota bacterium]